MSILKHLKRHGKKATLIFKEEIGEDDYRDPIYKDIKKEVLVEERIRDRTGSVSDERGDENPFRAEFYMDFVKEDLNELNPRPHIEFEGYTFRVLMGYPIDKGRAMRINCERVM